MGIEIPRRLLDLLADSPLRSATFGLVEAASELLADNKMPFFPGYTDHGFAHVEAVLRAAEQLVPDAVWQEQLLQPADAAVLVAATCLHDLALHVREPGFLELVSEPSRFRPCAWFDAEQPGRQADVPWPALWQAFRKQARSFTTSELDRLLGPSNEGVPPIAFGDADTAAEHWTEADRLLVGEFLRRHHARLSHEIALHGFPGLAAADFPVLDDTLPALADAIGAVARSHNEPLRLAWEYLHYRTPGSLQPDGAVQLYLMGLLRIADYFQIASDRASPLLLHLRDPQSPQSIDEWNKHQAVEPIAWRHTDPLAVFVQVSPRHGLRTHLQLEELLADLQRELDVTTAVLSEAYGATELSALRLSRQRVRTNLSERSLHERLSFVPRRARLRSAEDLFRLVISDLYGNQPAVAGRELLQNAVDAVRELARWEAREGAVDPRRFRPLPADVLVEIDVVGEGANVLRVVDRGIGMTADTVIESFLTAGATFSPSRSDAAPPNATTAIEWMKAGRFGVGVFAAFLLGSEVRVTTRHVEARRGITFVARIDDDLVQLDWVDDVPLGTEIVVPFSDAALPAGSAYVSSQDSARRRGHLLTQIARFYELSQPTVAYRIDGDETQEFNQRGEIPVPGRRLPDTWRSVSVPGFDAIFWRAVGGAGSEFAASAYSSAVAHNGILLRDPTESRGSSGYAWTSAETEMLLMHPGLAVFDTSHRLGVSLTRYKLADSRLPFEEELLRSIGRDVLAHALVLGPHRHPLGYDWGLEPVVTRTHWLPLVPSLVDRYLDDVCVLWIGESQHRSRTLFQRAMGKAGGWRSLPARVQLAVPQRYTDHDRDERSEWGMTFGDATLAIRRAAELLHREPIAGILMRGWDGPRGPRPNTQPPSRWGPAGAFLKWRTVPDPSYQVHELIPDDEQVDRALTDALCAFARALPWPGGPFSIGLTVMRRRSPDRLVQHDPLADPWIATLGGPLERAPGARARRRTELLRRDRALRALVGKWERLTQTVR